jgi:CIC family chloride channel protein
LCNESIYTLKLVRRGHYMPEALQTHFHQLRRAKDIMDTRIHTLQASSSLEEFVRIASEQGSVSLFLVEDQDRVMGVLAKDMAICGMGQTGQTANLYETASKDFVTVSEEATLFYVLAKMRSEQAAVALVTKGGDVVSPDDVKGVITRQQIGEAMVQGIELFAD